MKIAVQTVLSVVLSVIFVAFMLAVSPVAFGQESPTEVQAPFGLEWGAKKESFSGLRNCKPDGQFVLCQTKLVPKGLSDADFYSLDFHADEGLQRVIYFSEHITGDPFGTQGKERLERLRSVLLRKYPAAVKSDFDIMHLDFYKDPDEFYQCLRRDGCGSYGMGLLPGEKGAILLSIEGLSRGVGYITLEYISSKWKELSDSNTAAQKAQDEDAL